MNARLDRWLWAARFFRSRSLAAEAVAGGKVHRNGARTKPAHPVRPGDELSIRRGIEEIVVVVRGLAERRGPAAEAARLYEETEASRARRAELRERARAEPFFAPAGRPSKRDRRELERLRRGPS